MAHNWHLSVKYGHILRSTFLEVFLWWVQISIKIIYSQKLFKHNDIYKYYYLFRFLNQNCGRSLILTKPLVISEKQRTVLHFRSFHQFMFLLRFYNKTWKHTFKLSEYYVLREFTIKYNIFWTTIQLRKLFQNLIQYVILSVFV